MRIVPYSEKYKNGVIACLRRNIAWMNRLNDDKISKWLTPIIKYPWVDQVDSELFPYKNGMVLLDDNDVVSGFSALIHSKQIISGKECMVVNPSTSVVDTENKFYYFDMCEEMFKYGDIVYDFSPNNAAKTTAKDLFGFTLVDNPVYFIRPILTQTKGIKTDTHIENKSLLCIMNDHLDYGVKCLRIFIDNAETVVFYKIITRVKKLPIRTICILHVTNPGFFIENFKRCISLLSRKEFGCVLVDSRYVDVNQIPKLAIKKQKCRAILNPEGDLEYSFLYSELAILQNEMI